MDTGKNYLKRSELFSEIKGLTMLTFGLSKEIRQRAMHAENGVSNSILELNQLLIC